jgi:tetratricopeptide (TPR) repeat protein
MFLHRAIQSNPRFSSSAYNLALFYQRLNFLNDAEHWYLHAITHNPHHVLSHNNVGVLYMNIGRKALALHYFKAGLAIDPDNQLIRSNIPAVLNARMLPLSEIKRVYEEPSVCNLALVCISAQRSKVWGKLLTPPVSSSPKNPQSHHQLTSTGTAPVNVVSSFGQNVNLVSVIDDSDIPQHATPVQLRPEDYLQLLERALQDQPTNVHFRNLAIETCETLGRADCSQRHRSLLKSMHLNSQNSGKTGSKKKSHEK